MLKKGNTSVTLSINKNIYKKYQDICEEDGLILSKPIEKFMKKYTKGKKDRSVLDSLLGK